LASSAQLSFLFLPTSLTPHPAVAGFFFSVEGFGFEKFFFFFFFLRLSVFSLQIPGMSFLRFQKQVAPFSPTFLSSVFWPAAYLTKALTRAALPLSLPLPPCQSFDDFVFFPASFFR